MACRVETTELDEFVPSMPEDLSNHKCEEKR